MPGDPRDLDGSENDGINIVLMGGVLALIAIPSLLIWAFLRIVRRRDKAERET